MIYYVIEPTTQIALSVCNANRMIFKRIALLRAHWHNCNSGKVSNFPRLL